MLRFSSTALTELQTDALVVDIHCIGGEPSEALRRCSAVFSDVAPAYEQHFNSGEIRPGELLVLPPTAKRSSTIFLAPSRVHPKSELRRDDLKTLAKAIVDETLRRGFRSVALLPITAGRGLGATEIRRELLYSFSRSPELDLVYLSDTADRDPARRVSIFTDGGAKDSGGKGGYGVVLRFGDHHKELSGGFRHTTSNRMELMAPVVALEALTRPCSVRLYSDSRFVVDMVNSGLLFRRAASQWKSKKSQEVDLWKRFLKIYLKHEVELIWIKGHSGIQDNVRCDQLATAAMQSDNLAIDLGFQSKPAKPVPQPPPKSSHSSNKPRKPGDPCRNCGNKLIKRVPKKHKANAAYHFAWYLYCENCKRMYHVEAAKITSGNNQGGS